MLWARPDSSLDISSFYTLPPSHLPHFRSPRFPKRPPSPLSTPLPFQPSSPAPPFSPFIPHSQLVPSIPNPLNAPCFPRHYLYLSKQVSYPPRAPPTLLPISPAYPPAPPPQPCPAQPSPPSRTYYPPPQSFTTLANRRLKPPHSRENQNPVGYHSIHTLTPQQPNSHQTIRVVGLPP